MNRRGIVATLALAATATAGFVPAFASSAKPKPKPLHGTWTYTDATPDPSVSVLNTAHGRSSSCDGVVPAAPTDVNAHPIKITGKGTLTVVGDNTLDWAMVVTDAKGTQLAGSDGGTPQDKEGVVLGLAKPGTYSVIFCNLGGAPTATAGYTFKPR
jgi:hypothetical protein